MNEQPTIEGIPAWDYLRDVPDNKRQLIIVGDHSHKAVDITNAKARHRARFGICSKSLIDFMSINNSARGEPCAYNATLESHNCGAHPAYPVKNIHEETMCIGLRCGCESHRIDLTIAASPVGGTSALFATIAGAVLGYKCMYLCGIRLKPGSIYYDENVVKNWKLWKPILGTSVTIMGESWLSSMYNGFMTASEIKYVRGMKEEE